MIKEAFIKMARPVLAAALPFAAISCIEEAPTQPENTPTFYVTPLSGIEPNQTLSTKDKILERAKEEGLAVIFVTISNYPPGFSTVIKLDRTDNLTAHQELDHDEVILDQNSAAYPAGPLDAVFAGSNCAGTYKLSWSLDGGKTFQPIPLLDLENSEETDVITFNQTTCYLDVELTFDPFDPFTKLQSPPTYTQEALAC